MFNEVYFKFSVPDPLKENEVGSYNMAFKGRPSSNGNINFYVSKTTKDDYITTHVFLPPKTGRAPVFNELIWFIPSVKEIKGIKCDMAIVVKLNGTSTIYYVDKVENEPEWVKEAWETGIKKTESDAARLGKSPSELRGSAIAENMHQGTKQIGFARSPYEGDRLLSLIGKDPENSVEIDDLKTKYLFAKNGLGVYQSNTITGMSFSASKGDVIDNVKLYIIDEENSYHGKLPFGLRWSLNMDETKTHLESRPELKALDYHDEATTLTLSFRTDFNGKRIKCLIVKNKNNSGQSLELWLEN